MNTCATFTVVATDTLGELLEMVITDPLHDRMVLPNMVRGDAFRACDAMYTQVQSDLMINLLLP